ncbi:DUF3488 and DUF4129 domain-containing transglutaminase family protein [Rubinisphaera sp. JC750]|uniref:transglutaminase TgpA family protein n=1 Tax=Rubinisphaera sp. JC750 TaxID=2898658 RepID=UPI001F1FE7CF|nr:transglutaminaseTgpA domain-containing protein [Rubinisphaera sp. JC750]
MIDRIESTFRASLYLVFTLSTLCIGFAEGQFFPHFLTLPLILVAYMYLDRKPILQLDSPFTSVLGVAALVVAIFEFQQGRVNVEMRILSASHLLAYFSWIVLLIEKESQQYWWLLALSVLNMAVSASLTNSSMLGLAVIVYLFMSAWTLSLFTAFRGTAVLRPQQRPTDKSQAVASSGSSTDSVSKAAPVSPIDPVLNSRVRGGFQFDPKDNWLGYRLVTSVAFLSFASLAVGMAIFTMTPRIWIGNWELPSSDIDALDNLGMGRSVSGFTKTVQLGDMGEILENPTPVMEVSFRDGKTRSPMTQDQVLQRLRREELLFRGTTLSMYEMGKWSENGHEPNPAQVSPSFRNLEGVVFRHELEPIGRATIFGVNPVHAGLNLDDKNSQPVINQNPMSQELTVSTSGGNPMLGVRTLRYDIAVETPNQRNVAPFHTLPLTPAERAYWGDVDIISAAIEEDFRENGIEGVIRGQTEVQRGDKNDHFERSGAFQFGRGRDGRGRGWRDRGGRDIEGEQRPTRSQFDWYDAYLRSLVELDQEQLGKLIALSQQLCTNEDGEYMEPEERCLALLRYFRDPNRFSYSLNMKINDPTIDPVEDFVFNRKAGHCEYFASAMTLMLRGVGIPSRMVSGFKGGEYDEDDSRLYVQQRHAHTWTEAFVGGQWLVFDPTAAGDLVEDGSDDTPFSLAKLRGYFNNFWQTNVIGVSLARQQNTIYNPIVDQLKKARTWGRDFMEAFKEEQEEKEGKRKTTVQELVFYVVSVVAVLIIIAAVLLYFYFRSAINIFGWRFSARKGSMAQQQMLLFFRRFLDISARHGLKKTPQQTAREFAAEFERQFRQQLATFSLSALPLSLTDAYYQVRFRGDDLSPVDLDHWKVQLDTLGHALEKTR